MMLSLTSRRCGTHIHTVSRRLSSSSSPSSPLRVDFYFDTVSPYTWPAFEVLTRYRDMWDMEVTIMMMMMMMMMMW